MAKISICSLIYRSTLFAQSTWDSIHDHTPMLHTGEARFFFVANDATPEIKTFLKDYPHTVNDNTHYTDEELFISGYAKPEYISRVYAGWNRAIDESDEICVLVNSDHIFSDGWLEGLLKYLAEDTFVCSQLVEWKDPIFPKAWLKDFGHRPDQFDHKGFAKYAKVEAKEEAYAGGSYMPCAFYKSDLRYPHGNIAGDSFDEVACYGDEKFVKDLRSRGIKHITSKESIVYHFKEGEMLDGF